VDRTYNWFVVGVSWNDAHEILLYLVGFEVHKSFLKRRFAALDAAGGAEVSIEMKVDGAPLRIKEAPYKFKHIGGFGK